MITTKTSPSPSQPSSLLRDLFTINDLATSLATIQEALTLRLTDHISLRQNRQPLAPSKLFDAMSYAAIEGGKRLRPYLFLASCKTLGYDFQTASTNQCLLDICCALECLQAYSLVHDDLPGMDNSDLRRGKPSVHKHFDHHTAILAGSALQNLGFELLTDIERDASQRCALLHTLLIATGGEGMMAGQQWDMDFEIDNQTPNCSQIETMLSLKTGAFFQACTSCAWTLFGQNHVETKTKLQSFSHHFGLLYQLIDDCLDATSTPQDIGKPTTHDTQKKTLLNLWGLEHTKEEISQHIHVCRQALRHITPYQTPLHNLLIDISKKI